MRVTTPQLHARQPQWGCGRFSHEVYSQRNFSHASYPQKQARFCRRQVSVRAAAEPDIVLRSMSDNGEVSCLVVTGRNLVQEACDRHKTAPTASAALGRALLGTLLIACFKTEEEKTQATFRGDGILGNIQTIAEAKGMVKGKVGNPSADPPLQPETGKLDVGGALGKGVLAVVRSHPEWERPYTGIVELDSGEIAEDFAKYLVESEQQNSAIALGVSINRDASIRDAGGFLIQILPFASNETLTRLEDNIARAPSVTDMLHQGLTAQDITEKILEGLGVADSSFSLEPKFGPCEASALKDRMKRAVALLGEAEVNKILEETGKIEVTCEFCKDTYEFQEEEVMEKVAGQPVQLIEGF